MTREQILKSSAATATATAAAIAALLFAAAAQAQTQAAPASKKAAGDEVSEVVVTGTLLRGVAPTGTDRISVPREEIVATGVAPAGDLLRAPPPLALLGALAAGHREAAIH